MAHRDLKNAPRKSRASSSRRGGGGGVMAGLLIGLIVGVSVVVASFMYFSRAATPFTNMKKMERTEAALRQDSSASAPEQILAPGIKLIDEGPASSVRPAARPASAPAANPEDSAPAKDGQRFDFYKILPGQIDPVPADQPASASAKPQYLQLGAFQSPADADNLKAKLALIGIEASIQSVDVPGKGRVNRVRVGPFASQDELNSIRTQLKQNGMDPSAARLMN